MRRRRQEERLDELLNNSNKCVLVIGPPQVGKTNFICNYVERQLSLGIPCLFYPAISQEVGLLEAIRTDFEWTFNDSSSAVQVTHGKLRRILQASGQSLLIFVEGMNENRDFVRAFNADSERLDSEKIKTVISFTSSSARDILLDQAGNPTFAARDIGVRKADLPILEVSPSDLSSTLSVVVMGPYSEEEAKEAYGIYGGAFSVEVPDDHHLTHDPLLLRNAMEIFRGRSLPPSLNAQEILASMVAEKLLRARGLSSGVGEAILTEIGRRLSEGLIVTDFWLYQCCSNANSFFEAALLAKRGAGEIDFYVTSERAFVISKWVRRWDCRLGESIESLVAELTFASKTEVARDALRWFIVQPSNLDILKMAADHLDAVKEHSARKTVALCLCDLIASLEEYEDEDYVVRDLLDDLLISTRDGDSQIPTILSRMLFDESEQLDIRMTCSIGLAMFDPEACMQALATLVGNAPATSEPFLLETFEPGFRCAADEILETYYNSRSQGMCPCYLDSLKDDEDGCSREYSRLYDACRVAVSRFGYTVEAIELEELLTILNPAHVSIKRRPNFRIQPSLNLKPTHPNAL